MGKPNVVVKLGQWKKEVIFWVDLSLCCNSVLKVEFRYLQKSQCRIEFIRVRPGFCGGFHENLGRDSENGDDDNNTNNGIYDGLK